MSDAPYNFVPLSNQIVIPLWGSDVSHTKPFADGISGVIPYTLEALTPIMVGGNQTGQAPATIHFYQESGHYAIPGSSIRGMLRSVLEIATFSRMALVDDQRKAFRDLQHDDYKDYLTNKNRKDAFEPLAKGGWLKFNAAENIWQITPCDYAKIDHHLLGMGNIKSLSMTEKYNLWRPKPLTVKFTPGRPDRHKHSKDKHGKDKYLYYIKAESFNSGSTDGTLVFTGSSPTKHMEFIFFNPTHSKITLEQKVMNDFLEIHKDRENWKYWKKHPEIPVFCLVDKNNPNRIASLGLAQMYQLPFANSTHELISHTKPEHIHFDENEFDFAQLLFGVDGKLKGRIDCLTAPLEGTEQWATQQQGVLSAPKSSYYPNYLTQTKRNPNNNLKTAMDEDATISGWKRYPVRDKESPVTHSPNGNLDTESKFTPLAKGSNFNGKIVFHNLLPIELGALFWALTWGQDPKLRHSLGLAKSFGFGQCRITINNDNLRIKPNHPQHQTQSIENYIQCFMVYMNHQLKKTTWQDSPQITHLLGMADPANAVKFEQHASLSHMELKDFTQNKKDKKSLPVYPTTALLHQPDIELVTECSDYLTKKREVPPEEAVALWIEEQIPIIKSETKNDSDLEAIRSVNMAKAWLLLEGDIKSDVLKNLQERWAQANTKPSKKASQIYNSGT